MDFKARILSLFLILFIASGCTLDAEISLATPQAPAKVSGIALFNDGPTFRNPRPLVVVYDPQDLAAALVFTSTGCSGSPLGESIDLVTLKTPHFGIRIPTLSNGVYKFSVQLRGTDGSLSNCFDLEGEHFVVNDSFVDIEAGIIGGAGLTSSGAVIGFGSYETTPALQKSLMNDVVKITGNGIAIAAIKSDGSVITWGDSKSPGYGQDSSTVAMQLSSGVIKVVTGSDVNHNKAFAALKSDGSVVTWGDPLHGADPGAVAGAISSGIVDIQAFKRVFIAYKANGAAYVWGNATWCGAPSAPIQAALAAGVKKIFVNSSAFGGAFAAILNDGNDSVVTWGNAATGGDSSLVSANLTNVVDIIPSESGVFAALRSNGSVVVWGDAAYGGSAGTAAPNLTSGVSKVMQAKMSYAALKDDGTVITWGHSSYGGNSSTVAASLVDVVELVPGNGAWAALKSDGSVVTWGAGAPSAEIKAKLTGGVQKVFGCPEVLAALKSSGELIVWGTTFSTTPTSEVLAQLTSNIGDFKCDIAQKPAAIKTDGTIISFSPQWPPLGIKMSDLNKTESKLVLTTGGHIYVVSDDYKQRFDLIDKIPSGTTIKQVFTGSTGGNIMSYVLSDGSYHEFGNNAYINTLPIQSQLKDGSTYILDVVLNYEGAAAILTDTFKVVTHGWNWVGGDSSSVASELIDIKRIYKNDHAFAALNKNNGLVVWGVPEYGGDSSLVASDLLSGVADVQGTREAMAALKDDGTVVTWGASWAGGDKSATYAPLTSVTKIVGNEGAFVAIDQNGKVIPWGEASYGGTLTAGQKTLLATATQNVFATSYAFAALKTNGTVVTWGDSSSGGDSTAVQLTNVKEIIESNMAFAALKTDGTVVTWGDTFSGGNSTAIASELYDIVNVYPLSEGFLALRNDGKIFTWGSNIATPPPFVNSTGVKQVFTGPIRYTNVFGLILNDGRAVVVGMPQDEFKDYQLLSGVESIRINLINSNGGVIVQKKDGTIVTYSEAAPKKYIYGLGLNPNY